jgi:large subunit ribosomal protein L7/L12
MAELDKIVDQLSKLSVMEASELSKKLEETWGVTATISTPPQPSSKSLEEVDTNNPAKEKSEYDVIIESVGTKRISVIKEIKSITGITLKEAKELIDSVPKSIKGAVQKSEAEEIKKRLEDCGAQVTLK